MPSLLTPKFDLLEELSADELNRRRADMREKALKNEVSMLESARKEGREEGMKEGVLLGISALLDVKFGTEGLAMLPDIRTIDSLERLRRLSELLRQAHTLSELTNFLKDA